MSTLRLPTRVTAVLGHDARPRCFRPFSILCQRFLTEETVRPGSCFTILLHMGPSWVCMSRMIVSSSGDHACMFFLMLAAGHPCVRLRRLSSPPCERFPTACARSKRAEQRGQQCGRGSVIYLLCKLRWCTARDVCVCVCVCVTLSVSLSRARARWRALIMKTEIKRAPHAKFQTRRLLPPHPY